MQFVGWTRAERRANRADFLRLVIRELDLANVDALSVRGVTDLDAPATPHRVWKALQEAG